MRVEIILYTKYLVRDLAEVDVNSMNAKTLRLHDGACDVGQPQTATYSTLSNHEHKDLTPSRLVNVNFVIF
jgi:hypothetical protein